MWKLAVLLLTLLVRESSADCACYEAGNYTGRSAPISNPYQTGDFSACYSAPCTYVAYSGDDTYGWTGLTLNWGTTTNSGGMVEIFDGPSATGNALLQIKEGENVLSGSTKSMVKSSSPRITIKYSQNGTGANIFYGVIKAVPGLQPSVAPVTTTIVPSTVSYSNPIIKNNPKLITHDILLVINQRTNGGSAALKSLNAIAINFVSLLSITQDPNSVSSTRLSMASLTPYDPFYSIRGEIWGLTLNDVIGNLPHSGVTIEGNIDQALNGLVDLAFTVGTNSTTDSRRNVQRSVILLTAEWPNSGATLSNDVKLKFDQQGVNLLVAGFNLTDIEQSQLLRSDNRWYNAINTVLTNTTAIASFVNPFYFNDGSDTNYWCPPHPVTNSIDGTYVWFQEPYNYQGPYGNQNWGTDQSNGQSNRYCNYANSMYVYNLPAGFVNMTVKVFFELEAGRDFLNFYDDSNNLIATFSGYDISASTFVTTTPTLTARFISDFQSVFQGFYVSITPQTA